MKRSHLGWGIGLGLALALLAGCGRPTLPGRQFRDEQARTSSVREITSPLPKEPMWEAGASAAKVRIVAFYPIDDDHKQLQESLKGLVKQYPGKVYVKYVDFRTLEGQQAFTAANMTVTGLLINGRKEYTIPAKPNPYTVDFAQDVGRYWTLEDLKLAVAQEVAAVYGKKAAAPTDSLALRLKP